MRPLQVKGGARRGGAGEIWSSSEGGSDASHLRLPGGPLTAGSGIWTNQRRISCEMLFWIRHASTNVVFDQPGFGLGSGNWPRHTSPPLHPTSTSARPHVISPLPHSSPHLPLPPLPPHPRHATSHQLALCHHFTSAHVAPRQVTSPHPSASPHVHITPPHPTSPHLHFTPTHLHLHLHLTCTCTCTRTCTSPHLSLTSSLFMSPLLVPPLLTLLRLTSGRLAAPPLHYGSPHVSSSHFTSSLRLCASALLVPQH